MKLIDILVKELPKRGGWPKRANCITQDGDLKVEPAYCHPSVAKCDDDGFWFLDSSRIGGFEVDTLASDYTTAIITSEQYEAALAASKRCDHKWVPSEGRTQSGYLCSKCGNYDGPGYDWIDWPGGECPVPTGTLVDVKWRDGRIDDGIPAKISHDLDSSKRNAISWQHHGNSHDIIAYRLHQPQEAVNDEADLNDCIGQSPEPTWNGEGLPPVGCELQYRKHKKADESEWFNGEVKYASEFTVVIQADCYPGETVGHPANFEFRPIRSEADKKRDAAIEAIDWYMPECILDTPNEFYHAKKIYDAIAAGKIPGVKLEV